MFEGTEERLSIKAEIKDVKKSLKIKEVVIHSMLTIKA